MSSWRHKALGSICRVAVLCLLLIHPSGRSLHAQVASSKIDSAFFENRIRPLLADHCYECHSAKAKKLKGGLRLDTREDLFKGGDSGVAVVPGAPDRSLLIKAVRYADKEFAMPPAKDGGGKLPEQAIQALERWVAGGAPYPDAQISGQPSQKVHWAFQPIQHPAEPVVRNSKWPQNSIDRFILANLEAKQLEPASPADRRTLIRRATFDLTGLPPTPEEVEAFMEDRRPGAFESVVERLLNSPHYGERWARHWLDVVRYADTAGDTADFPVPEAWRYRNYVIDAFNADKPYDQFVQEQIAGDILALQGPREHFAQRVTATGYLAISRRFGFDSENYHHLTIQDTIDTLGQSVLGLTLGCARCHNHKFDPITSTEYYGLYGIFDSTRYAFPGSEQKQKYRAMASLVPEAESRAKWHDFNAKFAKLGIVPGAILRPLDDLDGDFEMQRAASGGSKGVLVQPWFYEGGIAVSPEAQSPFKHIYPFGSVGVSIPGGSGKYRIQQSLHPARTNGVLYVSIDFRAATNASTAIGRHRFWIGRQDRSVAVELHISSSAIHLGGLEPQEQILLPRPGQWNSLQLMLDLDRRTISGSVGGPGRIANFTNIAFMANWRAPIDYLAIESDKTSNAPLPVLALDNIALQSTPFPSVSTEPNEITKTSAPSLSRLKTELDTISGIDGDFELQTDGMPPAAPWHPGPKSVVKISRAAQSPFHNAHAEGELGIHMPNSGDYNGFGQTLPKPWMAATHEQLFASFDFRCGNSKSGGNGSWRFYLGHGPGSSAAIELFFNASEFFRRSDDAREAVQTLKTNTWYQVQLALNLKEKTYRGSISSGAEQKDFDGKFARGWDGTIDYTFIDSYGHINGVKPALDADNFVINATGIMPPVTLIGESRETRRAKAGELRRRIEELSAMAEKQKQELNNLLANGPVDLAYGVTEGTPHNARLQLRGEPDNPGEEVPRGFLKACGGGPQAEMSGSGRLELARWLTRPENPLTARVMVNRLWQYHFGQGLVKTPNDFGTRGQPPTHPELLDHLASQFIRNGWSMKAMHRLIMLSATYQQGNSSEPIKTRKGVSDNSAQLNRADLFSPFARRRLEAEELRDSILFLSGQLDTKPGRGQPFPPATSWGYTQHAPFSAVYDNHQRSVYLMTQRLKRHPFLALFDGADPNSSTPDRRTTIVPTQALYFLNDPFVHAQSEKFTARLGDEPTDDLARIQRAYLLVFGRLPTDKEQEQAVEFLSAYRAELPAGQKAQANKLVFAAFARVLFGSNEFLVLD